MLRTGRWYSRETWSKSSRSVVPIGQSDHRRVYKKWISEWNSDWQGECRESHHHRRHRDRRAGRRGLWIGKVSKPIWHSKASSSYRRWLWDHCLYVFIKLHYGFVVKFDSLTYRSPSQYWVATWEWYQNVPNWSGTLKLYLSFMVWHKYIVLYHT